jgi:hypothetical protein
MLYLEGRDNRQEGPYAPGTVIPGASHRIGKYGILFGGETAIRQSDMLPSNPEGRIHQVIMVKK